MGKGIPVKKGNSNANEKIIRAKSKIAVFLLPLFIKALSWYPIVRQRKGTDGAKWYKNMILGDTAHGSQKMRNSATISKRFFNFFLKPSMSVNNNDPMPIKNTAGFPEAKILATLSPMYSTKYQTGYKLRGHDHQGEA